MIAQKTENKDVNALVIGFGSIGKRHAEVLSKMGCDVAIVSKRELKDELRYKTFMSLDAAFEAKEFQYIVVANETHLHQEVLESLKKLRYSGKILIEKPVFLLEQDHTIDPFFDLNSLSIGYNLRFSPVLEKCKELSANLGNLLSLTASCGQFLPDWRPTTDYRNSYSANPKMGGGVLMDLSHEIDYCQWLAGPIKELCASGGKISKLEIQSNDVFNIIGRCSNSSLINIHVNYLERLASRRLTLIYEDDTLFADLIAGTITSQSTGTISLQAERNTSYVKMHSSILNGSSQACTIEEGLSVLKVIEASEQSNNDRAWKNV